MTDQVPDHTDFDELAAGHVLHALDYADEQRFLRHAEQCSRCQQTVTEFRAVAATLAQTAPHAEPSARLGERIMAVARADLAEPGRTAAPPGSSNTDAGAALDGTTPPAGPGSTDVGAAMDVGTAPHAGPGSTGAGAALDDGTTPTAGPAGTYADAALDGGTGSPAGTGPDGGTGPGGATAPGDGTRTDQPGAPPGPARARIVPLRRRDGRGTSGPRWQKLAVAAAAAVLIAVGGIWGGLAATGGGPPQPLAACAQPHACPQVTLTSASTHQTAAKVVIDDGVAWMEPSAMEIGRAHV